MLVAIPISAGNESNQLVAKPINAGTEASQCWWRDQSVLVAGPIVLEVGPISDGGGTNQ